MKLLNKKTGKIVDCAVYCNGTFYHSVKDVFEEWEDYEEPIDFWTINLTNLKPYHIIDDPKMRIYSDDTIESLESIGFKFETEEEAEKAVEKLKAWTRIQDNGFRFNGWKRDERHCGDFIITATDQTSCDDKDLDLLFGGNE